MSVLVTGGAGYIGSHMVHALTDAGEAVVVRQGSILLTAFHPELTDDDRLHRLFVESV